MAESTSCVISKCSRISAISLRSIWLTNVDCREQPAACQKTNSSRGFKEDRRALRAAACLRLASQLARAVDLPQPDGPISTSGSRESWKLASAQWSFSASSTSLRGNEHSEAHGERYSFASAKSVMGHLARDIDCIFRRNSLVSVHCLQVMFQRSVALDHFSWYGWTVYFFDLVMALNNLIAYHRTFEAKQLYSCTIVPDQATTVQYFRSYKFCWLIIQIIYIYGTFMKGYMGCVPE